MAIMQLKEILTDTEINRAARVPKIINKNSGEIIYRNTDPSQKWPLVVDNALKKPDEFQVYEDELTSPVDDDGNITWEEADLKLKSMPELRKIGQALSVTSNAKDKIIELIIKKQKLIARD